MAEQTAKCLLSYNPETKALFVVSPSGVPKCIVLPVSHDERTVYTPDEIQLYFRLASQAILGHEASLSYGEMRMTAQMADKTSNPARYQRMPEGSHMVWLSYDIKSKNDLPSWAKAPCPTLYRCGFRRHLSNWIIPEYMLPKKLLAKWDEMPQYASYDVLRQDKSESNKLHLMALESMSKQIPEVHASLIGTINHADEQLKKAMADTVACEQGSETKDTEKAEKYRQTRIKAALKLASDSLDSAIQSALIFDQYENMKDLLTGLQHAIAVKRKLAEENRWDEMPEPVEEEQTPEAV